MAKKKSTAAAPPEADLQHGEQLEMAASYIEAAMARIAVCAAALKNESANDPEIRRGIAFMLGEETHNDLSVAAEIFQTWKTEEVSHG